MTAELISIEHDVMTIELKVNLSRSMLDLEEGILAALNEAGCLATNKAL